MLITYYTREVCFLMNSRKEIDMYARRCGEELGVEDGKTIIKIVLENNLFSIKQKIVNKISKNY